MLEILLTLAVLLAGSAAIAFSLGIVFDDTRANRAVLAVALVPLTLITAALVLALVRIQHVEHREAAQQTESQ